MELLFWEFSDSFQTIDHIIQFDRQANFKISLGPDLTFSSFVSSKISATFQPTSSGPGGSDRSETQRHADAM